MRLNPDKCTFSAPSGKLLGYMVSHHGIDPNPDNWTQFTAREFKNFCADSGIKINYASMSHP
jgi:hypothetical protein